VISRKEMLDTFRKMGEVREGHSEASIELGGWVGFLEEDL